MARDCFFAAAEGLAARAEPEESVAVAERLELEWGLALVAESLELARAAAEPQ